jgi:hypothetical protein
MLGAQQAASDHDIGHIGSAMAAAAAGDNGGEPVTGCTSCAAFAGLTAAPPAFVAPLALAAAIATPWAVLPSAYLPASSPLPYTARAPPAIL